jgi:glutamyl-tRNA reductase
MKTSITVFSLPSHRIELQERCSLTRKVYPAEMNLHTVRRSLRTARTVLISCSFRVELFYSFFSFFFLKICTSCMHAIYTHIYVYIYTHTHTLTHTHIYMYVAIS